MAAMLSRSASSGTAEDKIPAAAAHASAAAVGGCRSSTAIPAGTKTSADSAAAPDLWPAAARPAIEYTGDIDDWLTAIATGRYVGVTPESTVTQYPRPGIAYRPLRDAPPVPVRLAWWRDDAHPATAAAAGLLTSLFRHPSR
jgi:hypothetical protein